MKKLYAYTLVTVLMCCSTANAQRTLLPLGQKTNQPWAASYFYAPNNGEKPSDNWYAIDFDESEWSTLEGPISTSGSINYYVTLWPANYSTYWVRRHFEVKDVDEFSIINLYTYHDDACEIYLNGVLIYQYSSLQKNLLTASEEIYSLLVEGDNVIAAKVSDTGGGAAFLDFGIEATNSLSIANPDFNNGTNGWSWTGNGFSHGGESFNYLARFLTPSPYDIHQTIKSPTKGLFKIKAQALEILISGNLEASREQYGKTPVKSYLYAGDTHHTVKNVFDEVSITNIYQGQEFYQTPEFTYVPANMKSVSTAFQKGMYENEFYAYIDTTTFNIGVAQTEQLNQDSWTCFDNFRVEHVGERALAKLIDEIETVSTLPMDNSYRSGLLTVLSDLLAVSDYESRSRIIASCSDEIVNARVSSEQYALIDKAKRALLCRLDTGTYMSDAAILESTEMIAYVDKQLSEGTIRNSEAPNILMRLDDLNKRLNYIYLDIAVTEPGSLGDSILSKVENFVDVKSIKLSGTLNEADFSNIQNRLSQLREIDMTDVEMTTLPNKFFYQRSLLEIVKLPAQLKTIGEYAFYQCYGIRNIEFPATLTTINYGGFSECDNLQEVILPEGFNSLGERAFYSCENNTHVKLPSTLKSISTEAFYYNTNLRTVNFSEGLTHINNNAFRECRKLDNLKFPTTLYFIGNAAFSYNSSLSNLEFNEGLYQITDNAFYECDALTEVTLPSSLVLANSSPFDYCDNLMKVTCLSIEPPYMTDQIPYGLSMTGRELYVPSLSINTYKQTTGWDKFPTIKPIDYLPENITVVGNLKLTLPETIPADYTPNVSLIHDKKGTSNFQYGSLTVNGAGTLSLANFNLIWDPNIQYNNNGGIQNFCSLINNSHLSSDNVTIDLYIRNNRWTFLTFPFDVKVSDIETSSEGTTNWIIRKYDGEKRAAGQTSETWVKMNGDDILKAGVGYIIQSSRYVGTSSQDFSGFRIKAMNNSNKDNIFINTDAVAALNEYQSEFAHNRSWNLIGNPYPCYYDTRFMDFSAPITVWNINNNTYTAYSPADDSYILCPGEAFFVQCPLAANNILFGREGRQTNRTARTLEAKTRDRVAGRTASRTIVNLTISDGTNSDRTRLVLSEQASLQYEMDKDASKFMSTDATVPQIYTSNENVNYAINERPLSDGQVCLSAYAGTEGIYTITLADEVKGYEVVLEDKVANERVVLTDENSYTFSAEAGTYTKRFVLHLSKETTDIENARQEGNDDATIYSIEGIKIANPTKSGIYIKNGKKVLLNR